MTTPHVLEPFSFPRTGRVAKNRLVLAAMTNMQSHDDGTLSEDEFAWLRARGGFGVVTTCAAHVAEDGQGWDGELGVFDDRHLPGLSRLAEALREEGALSWVQLYHGGVRSPSRLTGRQPMSASVFELEAPNFERPRAATEEDIERTIDAFAQAARRCADAGFDGVEIHGAHGYLITQFLGTITNMRDDAWGGSLERRARFAREVVGRARVATPDDFLVGIRLSPELPEQGVELDDALQVARWLAEDGVDFLHVSNWDSFRPPKAHPESDRPLTTWFRDAVGPDAVVVATGGVWTPEQADEVLRHGADLVGIGRAAIGNAAWPERAADSDWEPKRPPYTPAHLREQAVGEKLLDYMRRWPGFVTDGAPARS
jgi:2,4-dienoyl-CoA reductase-like NADH-dependent reductase (Old Yellow Enzyme family)